MAEGETFNVTASFGVASTDLFEDRKALKKAELMKAVDDALYEAKETGRNRVVCADDMPQEPA